MIHLIPDQTPPFRLLLCRQVLHEKVRLGGDSAGRLECTAVRMNPSIYGSLPSSACSFGTEGSYGPDRITKLSYDAAGRVTRQQSGYGTAAVGDDGVLTWTDNGKVGSARDGEANLTSYQYDGLDRLAKVLLPSTTKGAGTSSTTDYEQYTYDANGNVLTRRTRAGETLTFAYDNLDRLITKTVPERSGLASTHTRDVYYGYDVMSRPTYARFDSASGDGLTFVFDALGRMTSTTQGMDGASRTLSYLYDAAGRRTRVTWPDSGYVGYAYDNLDRPTAITDSASASLRSYTYGASGALASDSAGGVVAGSYGIDTAGRLSSLGRNLTGTAADDTTTFSYNPAGQLSGETRSNNSYAWTGHVNVDRTYTANGLNQYTAAGTASFTYDANGNLASDGTNTFTYDVENRLVGVSGGSTGSLRYDPLGRLYELTEGAATTRMLTDGDALVGEYNTSGTLLRRYAHGASAGFDDPVAWYEGAAISSATRRFLHADRLGSIVSVADNSGASLAINTYDEYGIPGAANLGRFQYTGQAWLDGVGLYHYKARMYSPTLGRFMQTDPIGYADGMNWYNYVGGDPVNAVDPSGLKSCTPGPGPINVCAPSCDTGVLVLPSSTGDSSGAYCLIFGARGDLAVQPTYYGSGDGGGGGSLPPVKGLDDCVKSFLKKELSKRGYPTNHLDNVQFIGTMTGVGPAVAAARKNGNPAITRGNKIYTLEGKFSAFSKPGPTFFSEIVHTAQYQSGDLYGAVYVGASVLGYLATGEAHNNHIEVFAHTFGNELNDLWNAAGGYNQCKK